jgi:hypothetical protein
MQIYLEEPYLEIEEIVESCKIHVNTIKNGISRNATCWHSAKLPDQDQRRTWIRYSTMKEEYKTAVCQKYFDGYDPLTWHKMRQMRGDIVSSWDFEETLEDRLLEACETGYIKRLKKYADIKTEHGELRERQLKCLARAATVLDEVVEWYETKGLKWKDSSGYDIATKWIAEHQKLYFPLKYLPMNKTRFKEKIDLMVKENYAGHEVIKLPRADNDHKVKFDDTVKKEILSLVVRQMISGKGWSNQQIIRMVMRRYMMWEEMVPSEATVRRLMNLPKTQAIVNSVRFDDGSKKKQKWRTSTPLARAMFAGDCWEMDGTKVQWDGFEVDGVRRSLYIVACRDVYSGAYLGWSYGLAENSDMYWEALRMAVEITGTLPYELRVDRFSKTNELETLFEKMQKMGMKYTEGKVSTSKAMMERGFKTLQEVFESQEKMWIGEGIPSGDENSRPTAQYLQGSRKRLKSEGWDWDKAWTTHNELMIRYNSVKFSEYSKRFKSIEQSPMQLYETCEKPDTVKLEIWDKPALFWAEQTREIKNYQLQFERRGEGTIIFDLNDVQYAHIHTHYPKVTVRYDKETLEEVMIFDPKTDKHLATIKRFEKIQLYGKDAEFGRNQDYQTKRKELQAELKKQRNDTLAGGEREVLNEGDLRLGAIIAKDDKEMAEDRAMEEYRLKNPPMSTSILHTSKITKGKKEKAVKEKVVTTVEGILQVLSDKELERIAISAW